MTLELPASFPINSNLKGIRMFICSAYLQSVSQGAWIFTNMMSLFVTEGFHVKRNTHESVRGMFGRWAQAFQKEADMFLPPSPASDPQHASSSQRCTSFPPADWTSCKPGCSRYVFSHLEKKAQRSRQDSFPVATIFHRSILFKCGAWASQRQTAEVHRGTGYLKRIHAGPIFGAGGGLLWPERLVRSRFTRGLLRLLHAVIFAIVR